MASRSRHAANPLNRYAIGDRDTLKANPDSSVDLYLQRDSPGRDQESHWLPADAGSFNVSLRLYWPRAEAVKGTWTPPPIKKIG